MPELPEVETVKETLKRKLLKKKIVNIKVFYDGIIVGDTNEFKKNIINQEIINIDRRGKFLIFELTNFYLVSHLRMEGKYFIKNINDTILKHEHIIFYFDDFSLRYHDTRKFGKMYLVQKDRLYQDTPLKDIGLEPWDKNLTINYLQNKYHSNLHIKTLLLDQHIISGIGNIYADEILFLSKINPNTRGIDLKENDFSNIINYTRKVLSDAIKCGGTTIRSYTSSLGVTGHFQGNLLVHTKEGCKCSKCGSIILKTKVNGRGTYYCPTCQGGNRCI